MFNKYQELSEQPTSLRSAILAALEKLGFQRGGHDSDPIRWSAGDLATDLADLLDAPTMTVREFRELSEADKEEIRMLSNVGLGREALGLPKPIVPPACGPKTDLADLLAIETAPDEWKRVLAQLAHDADKSRENMKVALAGVPQMDSQGRVIVSPESEVFLGNYWNQRAAAEYEQKKKAQIRLLKIDNVLRGLLASATRVGNTDYRIRGEIVDAARAALEET